MISMERVLNQYLLSSEIYKLSQHMKSMNKFDIIWKSENKFIRQKK